VISPDCRRYMISSLRNHLSRGVLRISPLYNEYISIVWPAKKSLSISIDPHVPRDPIHRMAHYITKPFLLETHLCSAISSVKLDLLVGGSSSSCKVPCKSSHSAMDSRGSSSDSGLSVEERLDALETALGRLRARADRQDQKLQATIQAGEQSWDLLNEDIRKLREEISVSSGNIEDFKEDVQTSFKDAANRHGNFGNRICTLEKAVNKLIAKVDK